MIMSIKQEIPDKLFFTIREVARLCEVKPHVLRYWEKEFPEIRPAKSASGQRVYRQNDIRKIMQVKTLLYDEGYTIAGAKKQLKHPLIPPDKRILNSLLQDIKQIDKML